MATSTALTAAPNPAVFGQSITFTATVTPAPTGTPGGTVSFYSGSTLLGTGDVNSLRSGDVHQHQSFGR